MKIQPLTPLPRLTAEDIERRDLEQINAALAALADLGASTGTIAGFRSVLGLEHRLKVPCGADAGSRRDLASRWSARIAEASNFADGPLYATFEIANINWQSPAHCPRVPLRTMLAEAMPRLKKLSSDIAFAPAARIQRPDRELLLQPSLRVLVVGNGLSEADAGYIDGIRRHFGRGAIKELKRTRFRPLTHAILTAEIARLLELQPSRTTKAAGAKRAPAALKTGALIRAMVNATLPFKAAAGGTGNAKTALRGAMGEWKASLKNRPRSKTVIASNEVYSLLSEVSIRINSAPMRLPCWLTE